MIPEIDYEQLWRTLYRYARVRGSSHHDAEDFAQDLFLRLGRSDAIAEFATRATSQDHFDALLLVCARRLLVDRHRVQSTARRGGGVVFLELAAADAAPSPEAAAGCDPFSPSRLLAFRELESEVETAHQVLGAECRNRGRGRLFQALGSCLGGRGTAKPDYPELARQLGKSAASIRVDLSRLRTRFRELVAAALAA